VNDTEIHLHREQLSYLEKIALAKLEESKAAERVRVIEYDQARFNLEFFLAGLKAEAAAAPQASAHQVQP